MKKHKEIIIVLLISAFALLINVGSYGVVETSDARYADISREMYVSGDYMHPNLIGVHHYHKPPFTYQISSLGIHIFGVNTFGVRFFLQLAVILQLFLVYAFALLLFANKKTALWAAIIYFSYPLVLISTRNLTTDAFLTTFALFSIYTWVKYRKENNRLFLYGFTLNLALGFLTKGPVIFIIPLPFILLYNYIEPAKRKIGISHLFAWVLFIVVGFSWYVYLGYHNTDFINYFLGRQTVDRFSKNVFNRTEPFWYFIAYTPLVGLPWLLTLPYLIKKQKAFFTKKSIYTVLLASIVIPLVFFSISSSKRILYILPVYSIAAVLTAQLLTNIENKDFKVIHRFILGFSILISMAFVVSPFVNTGMDIPKSLIFLIILLLIIYVSICKYDKIDLKSKTVYLSMLLGILLIVGGSSVMSHNELKINSAKPITDFIKHNNLKNRDILLFNTRKPSIAFGLNKSIISIKAGDRHLERETQFEENLEWKKSLIDIKDTAYLKNIQKKPTVLLTYKKAIPKNYKWITASYQNKKEIGKWTLYY